MKTQLGTIKEDIASSATNRSDYDYVENGKGQESNESNIIEHQLARLQTVALEPLLRAQKHRCDCNTTMSAEAEHGKW